MVTSRGHHVWAHLPWPLALHVLWVGLSPRAPVSVGIEAVMKSTLYQSGYITIACNKAWALGDRRGCGLIAVPWGIGLDMHCETMPCDGVNTQCVWCVWCVGVPPLAMGLPATRVDLATWRVLARNWWWWPSVPSWPLSPGGLSVFADTQSQAPALPATLVPCPGG